MKCRIKSATTAIKCKRCGHTMKRKGKYMVCSNCGLTHNEPPSPSETKFLDYVNFFHW